MRRSALKHLPCPPALPLLVAGLVLPACRQATRLGESVEVQGALSRSHPGTTVRVAWVNGLHHLEVRLDGPDFRSIPDSQLHPNAAAIAREVLAQFPAASPPDTITVGFVTDHLPGPIAGTRTVSISFLGNAIP
jgi:hypothetical protein